MYISFLFWLLSLPISMGEIPDDKPFVIVELFTSEGCSSCPSADRLLSEIVDEPTNDVDIIGLSFHVDYWDYIGWKDPYAQRQFSQRQKAYASKLSSYQVYTPQMVVNGKHEFVGSDRKSWIQAFNKEREEVSNFTFSVNNLIRKTGELDFFLSTSYQPGLNLNIAVVERGLSQDVTRGENRGRKLHHDNVVRAFKVETLTENESQYSIPLPQGMMYANSALVVYLQRESNYEILAARQFPLSSIGTSN